ncbi:uncharacterized protein [Pyrus communis]|uniref:uncharacterized protein n=1 Tax=Pyrus communis TaxID=23211 RepID=UPI0035C06323
MTHANLMNNYLNPNLVYIEEDFRRLFRMRRHVFKRLLHDVQQVNPYFRQKRDRVGRLDFSPHQKVTIALRMMAYGSLADSMDETHVLGRSPLFNLLMEGKAPQLDYYINGRQYNMRYYLANGIYPKWATLVQAIPNPRNDPEKLFTLQQKAYQKDVERAFDILQARWKIISEPLALVLPVATASVKRAFSAMNIIKSPLCNKIGDQWLNDSLVVYIEKDVFHVSVMKLSWNIFKL